MVPSPVQVWRVYPFHRDYTFRYFGEKGYGQLLNAVNIMLVMNEEKIISAIKLIEFKGR